MFKNLKQKVSSDQKVRTPHRNEASNTTSSGRPASATRPPKPSQSSQLQRLAPVKANGTENDESKERSVEVKNLMTDSPDIVQQTGHRTVDMSPNSLKDTGPQSSQRAGDTPSTGEKTSFFKRLEFLTPLKDQVARGFSESRESISSLVEGVHGNDGGKLRLDIVSHTNERARLDSVSDTEDFSANQHTIDISAISKDQLLYKVIRLEKNLRRYREKYSELSTTSSEAKRERDKVLTVMQQTQDKNLRRINELREQVALDLKAKMHLEEEFSASLEEKDQLIQVLQTQIAILKGEPAKENLSDAQPLSYSESEKKAAVLQAQLKAVKDTCEGLRNQGNMLQAQLDERSVEIEKINESNSAEKLKLIKQLSEAKNLIERLEEDKQNAVAESKRQTHEILEGKNNELLSLHDRIKKLQNEFDQYKSVKEKSAVSLMERLQEALNKVETSEAARMEVTAKFHQLQKGFEERQSKVEKSFDCERKEFVTEIMLLKEDASKQSEIMENLKRNHFSEIESQTKRRQMALDNQAQNFELQRKEKDHQMQLEMEERELTKSAEMSQQDADSQNLLKQLGSELEVVHKKMEILTKSKLEEAEKHEEEISNMTEDLLRKQEEHTTALQNIKEVHQERLTSKAHEFQQAFSDQKKSHLDELQTRESSWMKKMRDMEESHSKDVQNLKCLNEKQGDDQNILAQEQASKVSQLENEVARLASEKLSLSEKISDLKMEYKTKEEKFGESSTKLKKLYEKLKSEAEECEKNCQIKDALIKELGGKIELLQEDASQKQQDILLKSESAYSEIEVLHKTIEKFRVERTALEGKCDSIEEKLTVKEAAMKKSISDMEEHHRNEISTLSSKLDSQKQEFVVKIAKLEKEKLDVEKSQEGSQRKFLEAAGRLKALAQKFKATVADHEVTINEKNAALFEAQASVKRFEEKVKELEQISHEKQAGNLVTLENAKQDFERGLIVEKEALASKFAKEREDLTNTHLMEMEQLKTNLETKFSEETFKLSQDLSGKFVTEKQQILEEAREKFEIEKKNFEVQLLNQRSEAAEKDKTMLQSYEDVQVKLSSAEEDNAMLHKELARVKPLIAELQTKLLKNEEMFESISAENECVKQKRGKSEIKVGELEEELKATASELAELKVQADSSNADKNRLEAELKSVTEELFVKSSEMETVTKLLDSKNAELSNARKDFEDQVSTFQKSSVRIQELEKQIEKLQSLLSSESNKFQSIGDSHVAEIEKLNKDCEAKYATLKAKAEQKIAQQQLQLNSMKAELLLQSGINQSLEKEKVALENKIKVFEDDLEKHANVKKDSAALLPKLRETEGKLAQSEKSCMNLKNILETQEKSHKESSEALEKKLETVSEALQFTQSLVKNLKSQLGEFEKKNEDLSAFSEEKAKALSDSQSQCDELKASLFHAQSMLETFRNTLKGKDAEVQELQERLTTSDLQLQRTMKDFEALKEEKCERLSSLELSQARNEEMASSLRMVKQEAAEKEASLAEKISVYQVELKSKIEEETARLMENSEVKVADLKKKAERRLAQIKKTFTTQLEEKLKIISQLEGDKSTLEEKLASCEEEKEKVTLESDSNDNRLDDKLKQLQEEVENLQEEKSTIESRLHKEFEQRIQNVAAEGMKYEERLRELDEAKERLEQALEAKLKVEEENYRMVAAIQEETNSRVQSEARLAIALEDFEKRDEALREKHEELNAKIVALEDGFNAKEDEVQSVKKAATEQAVAYDNQLEAARKRSEKLEKDRESTKQNLQEVIREHQRQMQSLRDQVSSAQKQVEVLSKTAVDDTDVDVERKLASLKEDFDRRIKEKDEEMAYKLKKLVSEYESQIHRNNEDFEEKIEKLKQKNLSFEDSVRSQQHKELVLLQREIIAKEEKMEEMVEKYESEMHETEKEMSDRVDKAMYRAMTAEKRLQESDYERENGELKNQVSELNKILAETQQRERENVNVLQSLEAKVAKATPLADPDRLEYLRKVLYQYIMGHQPATMVKVLILLLQFKDLESQQILEKHGLTHK